MKEIKFRAINHETGKFVYGYYIKVLEGIRWIHYIIDTDTKYYIHDLKTLGQFTGLKDKNGKEIYEGDVVKNNQDIILKVEWVEHEACFSLIEIYSFLNYYFDGDELEVIGNIYENPELLK